MLCPHAATTALPIPAHLWEQVVHNMDADAVLDAAEDAVVTVHSGQSSTQVAPLLHTRKKEVGEGERSVEEKQQYRTNPGPRFPSHQK